MSFPAMSVFIAMILGPQAGAEVSRDSSRTILQGLLTERLTDVAISLPTVYDSATPPVVLAVASARDHPLANFLIQGREYGEER